MTRRTAYGLAAAAAVLPRLAVLLHERGLILSQYAEKSDRFAKTFVDHGTFGFVPGQPSAYTQPLYGWFLIPIYRIFGRHWWAVGPAQIAVAACTAMLVLSIGRRFLSVRWATAAAVVATLNPYLVWHDVHVNREILDQLLAAAIVLLMLAVAERPSVRLSAPLGAVSGLAMLGNTRLFALPVVLAAFLLWRRGVGRATVLAAAALLAFAALAVAPWLLRNRVEVGCWALTTDGRALYKANDRFTYSILAHGGWIDDVPRIRNAPYNPEEAAALYVQYGRVVHVDECRQMTYYERLAFTYWRRHPGGKARLMAQAASMLWSPKVTETSGRNRASSLDLGRRWVAPVYTVVLYVLAAAGIWLVPRPFAVLAVLLLAYNTVAALAFAGATRYRVPWDFLIALCAAAGAVWAAGRVRGNA
ncbi:MAG: glycosyltransferase family 39 protein [Gaiellaceae bacterium]